VRDQHGQALAYDEAGRRSAAAYIAGFFIMLILIGWHPDPPLGNSGIRWFLPLMP
jgi:hypothetical protein